MIEGLAEGIEDRMKELRKMCTISLTDSNYTDKVEVLLNDYEYIEENGKAYFVKKKKEYPKTYYECCKVLDIDAYDLVLSIDYRSNKMKHNDWKRLEKLNALNQILICRDAYWKLYGEEMGLGKPWEPDWTNYNDYKFVIGVFENEIIKCYNTLAQYVLAFPTEEMRDAFYENFEELIEICKELL